MKDKNGGGADENNLDSVHSHSSRERTRSDILSNQAIKDHEETLRRQEEAERREEEQRSQQGECQKEKEGAKKVSRNAVCLEMTDTEDVEGAQPWVEKRESFQYYHSKVGRRVMFVAVTVQTGQLP